MTTSSTGLWAQYHRVISNGTCKIIVTICFSTVSIYGFKRMPRPPQPQHGRLYGFSPGAVLYLQAGSKTTSNYPNMQLPPTAATKENTPKASLFSLRIEDMLLLTGRNTAETYNHTVSRRQHLGISGSFRKSAPSARFQCGRLERESYRAQAGR